MRMKEILRAALVKRWHTEMTLRQQDNAAHQYGVALIVMLLHPTPSIGLIYAALTHDLGEHYAGDSPYPAKADFPRLGEAAKEAEKEGMRRLGLHGKPVLTEDEAWWLRGADMLEAAFFIELEWDLGNKVFPLEALARIRSWFFSTSDLIPGPISLEFLQFFKRAETWRM